MMRTFNTMILELCCRWKTFLFITITTEGLARLVMFSSTTETDEFARLEDCMFTTIDMDAMHDIQGLLMYGIRTSFTVRFMLDLHGLQ